MQDYLIQICQDDILIPAKENLDLEIMTETDCVIPFATPNNQHFRTKTTSSLKAPSPLTVRKRRHSTTMYAKERPFVNAAKNEQKMVLSQRSRSNMLTARRVNKTQLNKNRRNRDVIDQWTPSSSIMFNTGHFDTSITGRQHVDFATTIDDSQADITMANGHSTYHNTTSNNYPTDMELSHHDTMTNENKTATH